MRAPLAVEFTTTHSFDDPPSVELTAVCAGGTALRYLLEPSPTFTSPVAVVATSCFGGRWVATRRRAPPPLAELLPADLSTERRAALAAMHAAMGRCFRFVKA